MLEPLLRRRFVVSALLVVSALSIACSKAVVPDRSSGQGNGGSEFKPFTFVHLGDPQIGFGRDSAVNDQARLLQAVKQINAIAPALVFLAGDLTHKNLPAQESLLEEALRTFTSPLLAAPGNHDTVTHEGLAKFRKRWGKDYQVFTHNHCDFIVVDSMLLSEQGGWFKQKDDAFLQEAEAQWTWLEQAMETSAKAGRNHIFLLMHVAPFLKYQDEPDKYENLPAAARKRLLELARKHGVRAILAGHDHNNSEVRSAAGPTIWVSGGTARVGKGETFGFHVWRVEKDSATCEFVKLGPVSYPATAPAQREKASTK